MSRRSRLIDAIGLIKDECNRYSDCERCPFYTLDTHVCGIRASAPCDWYVPDDEEEIEPIEL